MIAFTGEVQIAMASNYFVFLFFEKKNFDLNINTGKENVSF